MKNKSIYGILLAFLLTANFINGQDIAYRGGIGDGFAIDTFNISFLDYSSGGAGDGFVTDTTMLAFNDYSSGGNGDGFVTDTTMLAFSDYSSGGTGDGFVTDTTSLEFNDMARGGNGDGYSFESTENDFNEVYQGGDSDGFAADKYGHIIYWTGAVGTGWNVEGNWENDIIPNYCNPVVIPSGVPNFPSVNAGMLRIGYYKDEGDYRCKQIKINTGAELTTRVNCLIENYDMIFVKGTLFVKNPALDAFKNFENATILIHQNANVVVKE